MTNTELSTLVTEAMKHAQAANDALNQIDQTKVDKGVWNTLYEQGEAIGALAGAVVILAGPNA